MKTRQCLLVVSTWVGMVFAGSAFSQVPASVKSPEPPPVVHRAPVPPALRVCGACVRAHEEFLAADVMQGRGSATRDEWLAAAYVAAQLRQYKVEPAGEDGGYIQRVPVVRHKATAPPTLTLTMPGEETASNPVTWNYGKDFLTIFLSQTELSGPLQKIDASDTGAKIEAGAVVLITGQNEAQLQRTAFALASKGAVAELILASPSAETKFAEAGKELPRFPLHLEGDSGSSSRERFNLLQLSKEVFQALLSAAPGAVLHFRIPFQEERTYTWNAVGMLPGRDPKLRHSAVLFSAHLDHLGIGAPVNGDNIYNGADDDASGTTAVLELARVLGRGLRPRRTVIFALFGSEEIGGMGSTYFREHPPVPLGEIAANLEFEMIGRPDPVVKADTLWLTGWERSNLGPALAAHGAHLVGDPHPQEDFFARSDNYILAKKGVVAQTVSSYGLHNDYHQPSDDVAHLDFKHMDAAIGSLLLPVEWLVNSDFVPRWNEGGQP